MAISNSYATNYLRVPTSGYVGFLGFLGSRCPDEFPVKLQVGSSWFIACLKWITHLWFCSEIPGVCTKLEPIVWSGKHPGCFLQEIKKPLSWDPFVIFSEAVQSKSKFLYMVEDYLGRYEVDEVAARALRRFGDEVDRV